MSELGAGPGAISPSFDVTYHRADGKDMGEYTWTTSFESCEADAEWADKPQAYIKETWQRVAVETIWIEPAPVTCEADECDEDSDKWVQVDGKWRQFCLAHIDRSDA